MKFEWDDKKQAINIKKHGLSFFDAQFAFADTKHIIAEDIEHSRDEKRYYCFGKYMEKSLPYILPSGTIAYAL